MGMNIIDGTNGAESQKIARISEDTTVAEYLESIGVNPKKVDVLVDGIILDADGLNSVFPREHAVLTISVKKVSSGAAA